MHGKTDCIAHPVYRDVARGGGGISYEEQSQPEDRKNASWLCIGSDDCGLDMVSADSVNGNGRGTGEDSLAACADRLFCGSAVPVGDR